VDYALEVMKGGQIVERRGVAGRAWHSFGRAPGCDFVLEHPSISRLHAVLQACSCPAAPRTAAPCRLNEAATLQT